MFYDRYLELCRLKGVKPTNACLEAGLSRGLAAKWKATKTKKPSADALEKLSAYFNMSIDDVLGLEPKGLLEMLAEDNNLEEAATILREYRERRSIPQEDSKKAPTNDGERVISDSELKFALWGDCDEISDDDLDDVRRYAAFVRERKKDQKT